MKNFNKALGSSIIWILLPLFYLLVSTFQVTSQTVQSLTDKLAENNKEAVFLKELAKKDLPSIHFNDNGTMRASEKQAPVVLYAEPGNFSLLYSENTKYNSIELINIKIDNPEDLNSRLNLQEMKDFNNLKAIVFIFTYNACENNSEKCLAQQVNTMLDSPKNMQIPVYYILSLLS